MGDNDGMQILSLLYIIELRRRWNRNGYFRIQIVKENWFMLEGAIISINLMLIIQVIAIRRSVWLGNK